MGSEQSLWMYFSSAGGVVKCVMLLLFIASLASWTMIFQRGFIIKSAKKAAKEFEDLFWSGIDLSKLYSELNTNREETVGLATIFHSGFREYARLCKQPGVQSSMVLEGVQRAMRIANSREMDKLEQSLVFLATVGSTSPYVGLFGTVWGIMTSFQALKMVNQATISMVAPGISEALIATAMGLFAAIPAVIAYNRYSSEVERLENHYEVFQEELSNILYRQAHGNLA